MRTILLLISIGLLAERIPAQMLSSTDSLKFWGDAMISTRQETHRDLAAQQFDALLQQQIKQSSDSVLLNFHPSIVKASSENGLLRIYSWYREKSKGHNQYYACIFHGNRSPILLFSKERNYQRINFEHFNQSNWYGALYYQILPDTFNGHYILFGFAQSPDGTKQRIIETLHMENDLVQFGSPFFMKKDDEGKEETYHRIVLPYSPSAQIALEYDQSLQQIMHDHIAVFTDPKSGEVMKVPDGTFEAYAWKKNQFQHEVNLSNTPLEQAPVEKPLFGPEAKQRDILGRPKKPKG